MDQLEIVAVLEQYDHVIAEFTLEDLEAPNFPSYLRLCIKTCLGDHARYFYPSPVLNMRYVNIPGSWVKTFNQPYTINPEHKITTTLR